MGIKSIEYNTSNSFCLLVRVSDEKEMKEKKGIFLARIASTTSLFSPLSRLEKKEKVCR
jgi:hypothetical protein